MKWGHLIESIIFEFEFEQDAYNQTKSKILQEISNPDKISEYAQTNSSEWFAEAFSHMRHGKIKNTIDDALSNYLKQKEKEIHQNYLNKFSSITKSAEPFNHTK